MNIFITGGLGFVGRHLSTALLQDGHQITAVGRSRKPDRMIEHPLFKYLVADTTKPGDWQKSVAEHNIVINLAGKSIFTFWTKKVKKEIYDSRILTTRNLADSLKGANETIFFSASAVGYYGERGEDVLTEGEPPGDDFLAKVSRDWEQEALRAQTQSNRVVLTRFGIVLDRDGGAMASMIPAFKLFLGGRLGNGSQWFPWIHMHDLIAAYRFALNHPKVTGPANWCAPHPVRNRDLTKTLARKLRRPVMLPTPSFVIKTILGEFGEALICSQRALPSVLQDAGFHFSYGEIDSALNEIIAG
ncbi:MAG: TIGR01777 family oxidoreductase [Desulforhopalus sp.]